MAAEDLVPLDNQTVNIPHSVGSIRLLGSNLHEWGGITAVTLDRDSRFLRFLYSKTPGIKNWWRSVQHRAITLSSDHPQVPATITSTDSSPC